MGNLMIDFDVFFRTNLEFELKRRLIEKNYCNIVRLKK